MKATVLDTVTGLTVVVDGPCSWEWYCNNWSCDCNRDRWGALEDTGICLGAKRFLVVAVEFTSEEGQYTLEELNNEYPKELLKMHGICS